MRIENNNSNKIYGPAATNYSEFAKKSQGYILSEDGIFDKILPFISSLNALDKKAMILGLGDGNGLESYRLKERLVNEKVRFNLISTEFNPENIKKSRELGSNTNPIDIQASAEVIPLPNNTYDIVKLSQVIHWIPNLDQALSEIYRVLKPGGIMVAPSSSFLSGYSDIEFTNHPLYKLYLQKIANELIKHNLWKNGELFSLENPKVNQFFHRHSVNKITQKLKEAGFTDVEVETKQLIINKDNVHELYLRMFTAISLYIFGGTETGFIDAEMRNKITNEVYSQMQNDDEAKRLVLDLEKNPTIEPIPVFYAKKPITSPPKVE